MIFIHLLFVMLQFENQKIATMIIYFAWGGCCNSQKAHKPVHFVLSYNTA